MLSPSSPIFRESGKTNWIPDYLWFFLCLLILSEIKVESIEHCFMKAVWWCDILYHLCCLPWWSKWTICLVSQNPTSRLIISNMSEDAEEILSANTTPAEDGFITIAADNVDHNVRTLDGHETFHGMGFIAIVANIGTFVLEPSVLFRLNNYTNVEELVKKSITSYDLPDQPGLILFIFKLHKDFKVMLPFININSTNETWIYMSPPRDICSASSSWISILRLNPARLIFRSR